MRHTSYGSHPARAGGLEGRLTEELANGACIGVGAHPAAGVFFMKDSRCYSFSLEDAQYPLIA